MTAEIARYQFDTVEVRPASCEVLRDGEAVSLEPKALRVLLYLIENRGRAVTKDELIQAVWEGAAVTDNALTRIVAQLRRELGDDARQGRYIQTLPTLGYRFVAELKVLGGPPAPARPGHKFTFVAAAVVVLAAAAGLVWWGARRPAALAPVRLRPVQLTSSPGLDSGGSFSPDGNSIAYSSNRSGQFEIYVRAVTGAGHDVAITSDGRQNIEPAWSPDGKWIAYHSAAAHGIWMLPAGGGTPRRVSAFGSSPAWSPDSSQLAFRSVEPYSFALFDLVGVGDSTIWTVAADGSRLRQITAVWNPEGRHASPSWSPDGRRVLFAALGQRRGLWTVDVRSGALKPVPADSVPLQVFPVFAPDGAGVYFAGPSKSGGFSIYYVPMAGGEPREMHEGSDSLPLQIAISHDGRRMLYARSAGVSQIWLATAEKMASKPLYEDAVVRARLPVFSPDGRRLTYLVQRQGSREELWMMKVDGSGAAAVTSVPGPQGSPIWNADGTAILYSYRDGGQTRVRRINPVDGAQRTLIESKEGLGMAHVSPNEHEVVYATGRPENIWNLPLPGGPARQLTFDREGASFPNVSWDGQWIVYELQRGDTTQIKIMDRDGGRQEQLTEDAALDWANSWASDNRRIAYASFRDGVWNVWSIDRVTRERKQITHHTAFGSFVRNPAWRPGTEEIAYEHWLVKGNIYLIDMQGQAR